REDLAQRALRERGKAGVPRRRAVLPNVLGKQPRRPQFVRIAEVLGLATSQIDNEGPRLVGDDRFATRPRAIIERRHDAEPFGAAQTALDRLMRHPNRPPDRIKGRRLSVGKQHARPLDPARRLRPRPCKPPQCRRLLLRNRDLNHPPRSRHDPIASLSKSPNKVISLSFSPRNPRHMPRFKESVY